VIDLRVVKYSLQLAIKIEPTTRKIIENLAERENLSLGEAARELLNAGIAARGLEC
jgi:hypothetical protein